MRRTVARTMLTAVLLGAAGTAAAALGLPALMDRVSDRVEQYFARAQSLLCVETVRLQPLATDWAPDGVARVLVYDLRVSWDPASDPAAAPDAHVIRQLRTINGHPPKPDAEPGCLDPRSVSPEPLAFLLSGRRQRFRFALAGTDRVDGRETMRVDYRPRGADPPVVSWTENCVSVDLPAKTFGRVWVDAATADVVRIDERLSGSYELPVPPEHQPPGGPRWLSIERADTSIRYKPVTFHDPDETVMVPQSIHTLTVIRNAGVPRLRTTHVFSGYKRFLTDAHVVRD